MSDEIRVIEAGGNWVVRTGGAVIAESRRACEIRLPGRPPQVVMPREDVAMSLFEPRDDFLACPLRGRARYLDLHTSARVIEKAAWIWEEPARPELAEMVGFDPERLNIEQLSTI